MAVAQPGRRQRLARLSHSAHLLPSLQHMRGLLRHDVRILAYHRVLESIEPAGFTFDLDLISASAERFHEQMSLLRKRFHPMRFDEVLACLDAGRPLPRRAVLITFDDGYDDNYRIAYPILRDLGLSAMFFVSTGHIDSGAPYAYDWLVHMLCLAPVPTLDVPELGVSWRLPDKRNGRRQIAARLLERLKGLDDATQGAVIARLEREWGMPRRAGHRDCRPMSWAQLREMSANGMEVGSHGVGHRMLAKLPAARMRAEIVGSRQRLQAKLGVPAQVISYPVGGADAFDEAVVTAVRAAGYTMACSYISGATRFTHGTRYALRRLPVERDIDGAWFEAILALPELFSYPCHVRDRMRDG